MPKKLTLNESDAVYSKAINVLFDNGMLKLHAIDKEDLNHIASTLNWIKQLAVRIHQAPEDAPPKIEKVEPTPKKVPAASKGAK
jgi:hypothetical protein